MAFPRKLLHDGEHLVLDLRPHWRFLLGPVLALLATGTAFVAVAVLELHEVLVVALAAATLVALAWFVGRYSRWATTSFVVTDQRLVHRSGVLSRRGIEIPLDRVNTVFSSQTLLERLLRCGDLVIESGGEQGRQHVADIRRPDVVQAEIRRQVDANHARLSRSSGGGTSVPEQLEKLDELRRRGVVTQAEFEATKAALLERM